MHVSIALRSFKGRSPHDPGPDVVRLMGETEWDENGIPLVISMGFGGPGKLPATPQAALDSWKAPFEQAALGVSITEVAAFDVLPPGLEVKSGQRLIGIFSLSSNSVDRHTARIDATRCAMREISKLAAAAPAAKVP